MQSFFSQQNKWLTASCYGTLINLSNPRTDGLRHSTKYTLYTKRSVLRTTFSGKLQFLTNFLLEKARDFEKNGRSLLYGG